MADCVYFLDELREHSHTLLDNLHTAEPRKEHIILLIHISMGRHLGSLLFVMRQQLRTDTCRATWSMR